MASPNTNPLVKAADIEASLKESSHFLNPDTLRRQACLSDMGASLGLATPRLLTAVGLNKDLGVHIMVLPPNKSGCVSR